MKVSFFRLWICNKTPADNPEPQQLRYANLVPKCTSSGGLVKNPEFENFTSTINRFNEHIANQPIQGIFMILGAFICRGEGVRRFT